jgi:predicted ATP-dependent endonuclease of OLD family
MKKSGISCLSVEGLHDQFDLRMEFKPGLNIIYGKNGRGKTTALHILANALELDFKRFNHLNFRRIRISTFSEDTLEINRSSADGNCSVSLNGNLTSFDNDSGVLSEAEADAIRAAIGDRATYLPAFRSVLERIQGAGVASYYREAGKETELEEIEVKEILNLREATGRPPFRLPRDVVESRVIREEASTTARKTLQCRQWFGQFVPIVRYPSILEVDDGLSSEWRSAQLETAQREQNMFADVFVKVFRTIVGLDSPDTEIGTDQLLASIADSLNSTDYQLGNRESFSIYQNLSEATDHLKRYGGRDTKGIENAVLNLYLDTLVARKEERKQAFQKSRDFESSINKFLDKKTLQIGSGDPRNRTRSSVSVGTEGGRSYGLSSLSSGEKQILTMLYSASRSRFKSGTFLIDEPELSLHVDWQRQILRELMQQSAHRQIIACTHSPEVGGDHLEETQDFEPTLTRSLQDGLFEDEGAE